MTSLGKARAQALALYVAFCKLFTANCLEVRENTTAGEPRRHYRLREGVDVSLLDETERMIAGKLDRFRSFRALISELGDELEIPPSELGLYAPEGTSGGHLPVHKVGDELRQIVDDALAYVASEGC